MDHALIARRSRRTTLSFALPLVGACLMVVGCTYDNKPGPIAGISTDRQRLDPAAGPGLIADPEAPIPDVPSPVGFKGIAARSTPALLQAGARDVTHVYQGMASYDDTLRYYRDGLWQYDWTFVGQINEEDGSTTLTFNKGTEQLTVTIMQDRSLITLTVTLAPNQPVARAFWAG